MAEQAAQVESRHAAHPFDEAERVALPRVHAAAMRPDVDLHEHFEPAPRRHHRVGPALRRPRGHRRWSRCGRRPSAKGCGARRSAKSDRRCGCPGSSAAAKTSASAGFAHVMPTAPAAICSRAIQPLLCVLPCGRRRLPPAAAASAMRAMLRRMAGASTTTSGVWSSERFATGARLAENCRNSRIRARRPGRSAPTALPLRRSPPRSGRPAP